MLFIHHIKRCFIKAFKFSGRTRKVEFYYYMIFVLIGCLFSIAIDLIFKFGIPGNFAITFIIIIFIPLLSVAWRRLHDVGKSGWWLVVPILAYIESVLIAMAFNTPIFKIIGIAIAIMLSIIVFGWMAQASDDDNEYGSAKGRSYPLYWMR